MNATKNKTKRMMAAYFAVLVSLLVLFAPVVEDEADGATDEYWSYTLNFNSSQMSVSNGSPLSYGSGMEGLSPVDNTSSSLGTVTSTGSWDYGSGNAFVDSTFYGVFTDEGELYKVLNPDDLTEYEDGTDATADIKTMNVLWCVPTIYWSSTSTTLTITNNPNAGGTAYAHTIDGHVYDYLGYGVYEGTTQNGKLMSISDSSPTASTTRSAFRTQAAATFDDTYGESMLWNFYQWELYKYIVYASIGDFNSQAEIGNGVVSASNKVNTGATNEMGPFAGATGNSTSSVKAYIENAWGSLYEWVDDYVQYNGSYWAGQNSVPTDTTSGKTAFATVTTTSDGYVTAINTNAACWGWGTAFNSSSSASSTGTTDYQYNGNTASNYYALDVGGDWGYGSYAGVGYAGSDSNVSYSDSGIGARLAYVFDADAASALGNTVTYDHSELTGAGGNASGLATSVTVPTDESYQLPNLGTVGEYTHIGWRVNGQTQPVNYTVTPTDDMTVTSLWRHNSTITFDHSALTDYGQSAAGLATSSGAQPDGTPYTLPSMGVVGGYTHTGWYINGVYYAAGAQYTPSGNVTAMSVWQMPMITITYIVEGQTYATLTVPGGTSGVVFTPVMVEGVFEGWYYDSGFVNEYDASQALDDDTTLYARGVPPLVFTSVPTANAQITAVAGTNGLYYFDATDSDGRYQVHWDFGDGNESDDVLAYNEYAKEGVYTVTLTVTNADGESAVSTYTVDTTEGSDDSGNGDDGPGILVYVAIVIAIIIVAGVVLRRVL